MKNTLSIVLLAFCLFLCAWANADEDTPLAVRLAQTASGRGPEYVTEISEGWRFDKYREDALAEAYDDSIWPMVNLPHTWNVKDGADGSGNYRRSAYLYRKKLEIHTPPDGKRVYIEFLGANQKTNLYVNDIQMKLSGSDGYTHKGGYTAFRYDITEALRPGANLIAVSVSNEFDEEIAPISGDFNMYGGLYRRVFLITVDELHFDLSNFGSSGLFLTTPNVRSKTRPADLGALNIRADIVNDGGQAREFTVTAHIEGDNAPEDMVSSFTVPAHGSVRFDQDVNISDPHLWQGIDYSGRTDNSDVGYRYTVTLTLSSGGKVIDAVSDKVGFRYFYVDKDTGFYLNGESYPLRGVNRHQYKEGMGSAITEKEHEEDLQLIMELGANTVRLCHYPHTDYFYDLCDENGIILWTEIPLVNAVGKEKGFSDVMKSQLTELIRQQYNRPSICFWGLQNEIADNTRSEYITAKKLLSALDDLAHAEDGSGRYTTQAIHRDEAMDQNDPSILTDGEADHGWKSDLLAWNIYTGWYPHYTGTFEEFTDSKAAQDSRPLGISEYGWGGSTEQHELYPEQGKNDLIPTGKWHPEEYQCLMHEQAIAHINENDSLWGTYIWCMFDFDVDKRDEGARVAQNDKGLVTNDRTEKKDAFYLYKANWNKTEPFVHINSARYVQRDRAVTYVKVYSNCESVTLYLNGELTGDMASVGNGVFMLENVILPVGESKLHAVGRFGEQECHDTCKWTREVSTDASITSDALLVDAEAGTITLPSALKLSAAKQMLTNHNNAHFRFMQGNVEVTDEQAMVFADMKVMVTAENGKKRCDYTFDSNNLFSGKTVNASSSEKGNGANNAIDGDSATSWVAANNQYPQNITVDLGESYYLGTLSIAWYTKGDRSYTYTVEVSEDGNSYTLAIDRRGNKVPGTINDDMRLAKGRFVRINVLSCSEGKGYAGLKEIKIDGWSLTSDRYEIDHENRLIVIPGLKRTAAEEIYAHLAAVGNGRIVTSPETDCLEQGSQVILMDIYGREFIYTVTAEKEKDRYPNEIALYKTVYFSSEEGTSSTGTGNRASNVNDGYKFTEWTAKLQKEKDGSLAAKYPEWVCVDLGAEYDLSGIELLFETKQDRIYQFQVYASAEGPLPADKVIQSKYQLIIDQSHNSMLNGGHYKFDVKGKTARYVAVLVLGNTLYPEMKYASAGIYDFKVYGTPSAPDQ